MINRRQWLAGFLAVPGVLPAETFTASLWRRITPLFWKTLAHPFLKGLTDGSLPRSRFEFYLIQDRLYLRRFGQALSLLAAKAPREEWAATLNRHAISTIEAERQLHDAILKMWRVPSGRLENAVFAPQNYAYTNHLLIAAGGSSFAVGLAAVLPCYWIYLEVGRELLKKGSKEPAYQKWIDTYASEAYEQDVRQVLDMMDALAAGMSAEEKREAAAQFERSARYEYMFWDMAWREESWPPE